MFSSKLLKRLSPFVVAAFVVGCGPAPEAPAQETAPETVTPADPRRSASGR